MAPENGHDPGVPESPIILDADQADAGERLDIFIHRRCPGLSRSRIGRLIKSGQVLIGQEQVKPSYRIRGMDIVRIRIPPPVPISIQPEAVPLQILFEDEHLVAVSKPRGMVVHPGAGRFTGTLVHALLFHCPDLSGIGGQQRPGIVHRLDKGTSGVILAAKTDQAHLGLSSQFSSRSVMKEYRAVTSGYVDWSEITIRDPIGRHPKNRKQMAVVPGGREAETIFHRLDSNRRFTYIAAFPKTGRTHQIRVHLKHAGLSLLGDELYGSGQWGRIENAPVKQVVSEMSGLSLHAYRIVFNHPVRLNRLDLIAPLPEDFRCVLKCTGLKDTTSGNNMDGNPV
ncbi:RluA family pseudouridine synthase [bacterium]|nr:RluA family pseudouridine synthase [candidate division CSSED10-310 bacterium]